MGGIGSGRYWDSNAKDTVNSYRNIDIRSWCREGLLTPGTVFYTKWLLDEGTIGSIQVLVAKKCLILSYRYRNFDEWTEVCYPIKIEWTACTHGGERPWFHCPAKNCGKRVAILYGGAIFACRHCYKLTYPSQRENIGDRTARKAEKVRERLRWEPGILNGEGLKPKGMHWKTFERLYLLHNKLARLSLKESTSSFGMNIFDLYYNDEVNSKT